MIKILATIGPASVSEDFIASFSRHTNLFRLNGSHSDIDWHRMAIKKIRSVIPNAVILMDIPGIKPRTANTKDLSIKKGQQVIFGDCDLSNDCLQVPLTKPLPCAGDIGNLFSLNDGQFIFQIVDQGDDFVIGKSCTDFTLLPRKGLNMPGSVYDEVKQLEIYTEFVEKVLDLDINALGLSFVQTGQLVDKIRKKAPQLLMISKIENSEGLRNCKDITKKSDAIMIDRGDLAAEIGLPDLYDAVVNISNESKSAGKPLIIATENLETMMSREMPSKSEVMSLGHSISIGADCIMLSEETAISSNGPSIVSWLSQYLKSMVLRRNPTIANLSGKKFPEVWEVVKYLDQCAVILMTKSGHALFDFMAMDYDSEVTVVTNSRKVIAVTKLFSRDISIITLKVEANTPIETIWEVVNSNKISLFKNHDKVAAIFVSKYVKKSRANCITFFHKSDFIL